MSKDRKKPVPGDHIWVERSFGPFPYTHHGIYVFEDVVINRTRGKVRWITLKMFQMGEELHIQGHSKDRKFSPDEVVARAQSRLGEKGYDITDLNPEHFATWCVTGSAFSKQVHDLPGFDGYSRHYS
jgi:hypothetical protein